MENKKPWYQSKALWAGVVAVLISGYNSAVQSFGLPAIPEFVYALLGALGIYSRVTATTVLTK